MKSCLKFMKALGVKFGKALWNKIVNAATDWLSAAVAAGAERLFKWLAGKMGWSSASRPAPG